MEKMNLENLKISQKIKKSDKYRKYLIGIVVGLELALHILSNEGKDEIKNEIKRQVDKLEKVRKL